MCGIIANRLHENIIYTYLLSFFMEAHSPIFSHKSVQHFVCTVILSHQLSCQEYTLFLSLNLLTSDQFVISFPQISQNSLVIFLLSKNKKNRRPCFRSPSSLSRILADSFHDSYIRQKLHCQTYQFLLFPQCPCF